mgnify:CR=1 FL=1
MLVLTRSVGERLMINGGEIKLSVLDVKGSQVRIGIEAPKEVTIHREEVFHRIQAQEAEVSEKHAGIVKDVATSERD